MAEHGEELVGPPVDVVGHHQTRTGCHGRIEDAPQSERDEFQTAAFRTDRL